MEDGFSKTRGEEKKVGPAVERARRGVEAMEVVEETCSKASTGSIKGRMVEAARSRWNKVRAILKGKTIMKDGESLVIEEKQVGTGKCVRKDEEFQGEWEESEIRGTVEVLEEGEDSGETQSCFSGESRRTRAGFEFLEEMGDEGVDLELEEKISTDRKRKRVEDVKVVRRGLLGSVGWEWREKEGREEKRWKRMAGGFERGDDGKLEWKEKEEKIPLPEEFRLGLEERGPQMNHSGWTWNNFGNSKTPVFPGGKD
jgi:hypothetical protein